MSNNEEYKRIAESALNAVHQLLGVWLPNGKYERHEYVALNPNRADKKLGSFKINTNTGLWSDFAAGESGGDLIALYAYLFCGGKQGEALKEVRNYLGMNLPMPPREKYQPENHSGIQKSEWQPIVPFAERCLDLFENSKSFKHFTQELNYTVGLRSVYRNANGEPMFVVQRFFDKEGVKHDRPFSWCQKTGQDDARWKSRRPSDILPLFGLDELAAQKQAPVLLVEGEKCKQIAAQSPSLQGFVVMCWHGGSNGYKSTDWSPLAGRDVILWADADALTDNDGQLLEWHKQGGMAAMLAISEILHDLGAVVQFVDLPEVDTLPHGYDVADAIADDCTKLNPLLVLADDNLVSYDEMKQRLNHFRQPENQEMEKSTFPQPPLSVGVLENETELDENKGDKRQHDDISVENSEMTEEELAAMKASNLKTLSRHFAVIEGKNKFFNKKKCVEFSYASLSLVYGKDVVEQWLDNPRKLVLTQSEVNKAKKEHEIWENEKNPETRDMLARYVYLDGSAMIWDNQLWKMIEQSAAKLAMGDMFKVWLNSPTRQVIPFENVVFEPGINLPNNYINLFRGLPFQGQAQFPHPPDKMPTTFEEVCMMFPKTKPIQQLIWHLCNNEFLMVQFFMNWLAYPLQNVGAKMKSAMVFHGEIHGAGKSLFFEDIMKPLYGDYAITLGQTDLESPYTGNRLAKLFVLFEEIFNNKQKFDHTGAMKHMITGKTMRVEQKFKDSIEQSNYINCAFLSNDGMPFKIEENDRRYGVSYPQAKLPPQLKNDVIECLNSDGLREFYSLLMAMPLTVSYYNNENNETIQLDTPIRFTDYTEPPMTEAKQRIIAFGRTAWQTFFNEWKRGEIEYERTGEARAIPYTHAMLDDVFRLFQAWCRKNNESQSMSRKKFIENITQPRRMRKFRANYRCKTNNQLDDKVRKAQVVRPCDYVMPHDRPEMDVIGGEIMKFKFAVDDYCGNGYNHGND